MRNLNYFYVLLTLIMIVVFGGLFLLNGKSYKGKNGGEEKKKCLKDQLKKMMKLKEVN